MFYKEQTTIALRRPNNKICQNILSRLSYPLPSTSVNVEGKNPLNNLKEIKSFLKNEDITIYKKHYTNKKGLSSTLIRIKDEKIEIMRKGSLNKKILDLLKI